MTLLDAWRAESHWSNPETMRETAMTTTPLNPTVTLEWLRDQTATALSELRQVREEFPELDLPLRLSIDMLDRGLAEYDRAHSFLARRGALVGTLSQVRVVLGDLLARRPEYGERSSLLWDAAQLAGAKFVITEATQAAA